MGSSGLFVLYWTLASVLAVVCWNVVKFIISRASQIMAGTLSAHTDDVVSRPLVDAH